ncbi:MAG: PAS domain S-box protein, partial [Syntrophales bacterium]|nr:PAS domain S-box protein [Syntrophales bacterium]
MNDEVKRQEQRKSDTEKNHVLLEPNLDRIRTGLVLVDGQTGAIIQANKAAIDLFGIGEGDNCLEKICRDIASSRKRVIQRGTDGDQAEEEPPDDAPASRNGRKVFKSVMPCSLDGKRYLFVNLVDVTDPEEFEQALRESEQKFRSLFDHSPDAVYCFDPDGRFMTANTRTLSLSGYSTPELRMMTFDSIIAPDDRERTREHFRKALRGEPQTYEIQCRKKDGIPFHVQVTNIPMIVNSKIYGVYGIAKDITKFKKMTDILRDSEEKYRQLFNMESDAVFLIDNENGDILEANDSAAALYGYGHEELLKMKHTELSAEPARTRDATLKHKGCVPLRYHKKKDGTVFPCEIAARHLMRNNRFVHIAAIRDITERMQKEHDVLQSLERLRNAMGAIIQATSAMTEARDPYTSGHQRRVANLARSIAKEMELSQDSIEAIRTAGVIHDIGKISVPAEILSKPAKLSEPELGLIRNHPTTAYNILKDIEFPWPIAEIIYQHHERMDGSGYPRGLKGDAILVEARILAVADVVEAMASHRPYR